MQKNNISPLMTSIKMQGMNVILLVVDQNYTIAMGYKFKKINNRQVLIEQPHIVFKRIKFLRQYLQYLESDKYIFAYLDET
jgi:hypothetical protein